MALADVSLTYAMDCYKDVGPQFKSQPMNVYMLTGQQFIGDAFVGVVSIRNAFATIIATKLTPWIAGVGLVNMFVISTVLAFVLSILAVPMMIWEKRVRVWTRNRLEVMTGRQFDSRG